MIYATKYQGKILTFLGIVIRNLLRKLILYEKLKEDLKLERERFVKTLDGRAKAKETKTKTKAKSK